MARWIELTRAFGSDLPITLDANRIGFIIDNGKDRAIFLEGDNSCCVLETTAEIVERAEAASDGRAECLITWTIAFFAALIGLITGLYWR